MNHNPQKTDSLLSRLTAKFLSRKFLLFMAGGGISYGLKASLSWLLSEKVQLPFIAAYALTLAMVIIYNFCYSLLVTFRVKGGIAGRFLRYVIFIALFNGCDYLMVQTLYRTAPWSYQISIFLVTGFLMVIKFFVFDRWVFHEVNKRSEEQV